MHLFPHIFVSYLTTHYPLCHPISSPENRNRWSAAVFSRRYKVAMAGRVVLTVGFARARSFASRSFIATGPRICPTVVAPEIAPFVISEKPANWGETVTATCTILKGDQPILIEWALNGESISHDFSDITIATSKRVSLLTIDAVTASHAGEYTCVASNAAGGTSYSASLAINGTIRRSSKLLLIPRCMYESFFSRRLTPTPFIHSSPSGPVTFPSRSRVSTEVTGRADDVAG